MEEQTNQQRRTRLSNCHLKKESPLDAWLQIG
jgi:hypothetical protein